jgi:hypothetical protein
MNNYFLVFVVGWVMLIFGLIVEIDIFKSTDMDIKSTDIKIDNICPSMKLINGEYYCLRNGVYYYSGGIIDCSVSSSCCKIVPVVKQ